jgi:hypothetical protein
MLGPRGECGGCKKGSERENEISICINRFIKRKKERR